MSTAGTPLPDLFSSEQVITCSDDTVGLRAVIAIDDLTLGPGFGGVRWRPYPDQAAAVSEAQRLAAAMTLKHALADLPYGGAKSVVVADGPLPAVGSPERTALMSRFGDMIARTSGSYIPGVDMGTTLADMSTIRDRGARAFCADVDPGPFTAAGVYAAMRAGVRHVFGGPMDGIHVVVQGAGSVGAHLARSAAADGARVTIADIDAARARDLAEELGGETTDPAGAPYVACDVFAPCAVARVLTADRVPDLRCRVVAGAANDTLDHPDVAGLLHRAAVVFVPDFVANAGGVIQVHADEVGWSRDELDAALERIGDRVGELLDHADSDDITPVQAALARADRRLEEHR